MGIDLTEENYKIHIDGKWNLEDLYIFPHTYEQVYFLIYSLLPHEDEGIQEKIQYAYSAFPWQGGYSAVNFYNKLKYTTPKKERPQVLSMQYASPGWIELTLIIGVAVAVERIVKAISTSIREANSVYHEIHVGMSKRKLLRIESKRKEIELEQQHADYIQSSANKMVQLLGLKDIEQMHQKSGSPLKTLKILLSLYRRVRTLAEFQGNGKTKL
ncbi:MAG: hypothetical protein OEW89_01490 [Gammaproteobacteria bacterium]|nr:hypothetical protein [Gammaproteobacteria bacterium]